MLTSQGMENRKSLATRVSSRFSLLVPWASYSVPDLDTRPCMPGGKLTSKVTESYTMPCFEWYMSWGNHTILTYGFMI